jgi:hypothetical protein
MSHLDGMTFVFPNRGFNIRDDMPENYARLFIPRYISVKGVGENELVWILKSEYERLPEEKKIQYREVDPSVSAVD